MSLLSPLQPAVCTRELCVFSFYTLGVMSGAAEEVATGAEVLAPSEELHWGQGKEGLRRATSI